MLPIPQTFSWSKSSYLMEVLLPAHTSARCSAVKFQELASGPSLAMLLCYSSVPQGTRCIVPNFLTSENTKAEPSVMTNSMWSCLPICGRVGQKQYLPYILRCEMIECVLSLRMRYLPQRSIYEKACPTRTRENSLDSISLTMAGQQQQMCLMLLGLGLSSASCRNLLTVYTSGSSGIQGLKVRKLNLQLQHPIQQYYMDRFVPFIFHFSGALGP